MASLLDRFEPARSVADAVLYEGYVLYPYRASSPKNQTRWQFGVLVPPAYAAVDGSERCRVQTQCLLSPAPGSSVAVRVRCLQIQHRIVEDGESGPVERLEHQGIAYVPWDEAVDRVVDLEAVPLAALVGERREVAFSLPPGEDSEPLTGPDGQVVGRIVRRREEVTGRLAVAAVAVPEDPRLFVVTVVVDNTTEWSGVAGRRDDVIGRSLVAVHTMIAVDEGQFVSLLDPPPGTAAAAAADCSNDGAFPILIDDDRVILSSPIILYDHPAVAPESPGDLYDSTEIDEILALRVLTLTDEEKAEARATDPRAAAIVDRCDEMAPDAWERLHGIVRPIEPSVPAPAVPWWDPEADAAVDPWSDSVVVAGVEVSKGTLVRLRPTHRADAQDLFLVGMQATVAGVFKDVDGTEQVAVSLDDDPATTELAWQGRYLFFHPDEVQPLAAEEGRQ
jgi:hypothetical protein